MSLKMWTRNACVGRVDGVAALLRELFALLSFMRGHAAEFSETRDATHLNTLFLSH